MGRYMRNHRKIAAWPGMPSKNTFQVFQWRKINRLTKMLKSVPHMMTEMYHSFRRKSRQAERRLRSTMAFTGMA